MARLLNRYHRRQADLLGLRIMDHLARHADPETGEQPIAAVEARESMWMKRAYHLSKLSEEML